MENTDFLVAHSPHLDVGLVHDFPYFLEVCKELMGACSLWGVLVLSRFVQSFGVEHLGALEAHIIAWVLLPLAAHSSCLVFYFLLGDHTTYVAFYSPAGYNPDLEDCAVVEYIKPLQSFPCMQATLGAHMMLRG